MTWDQKILDKACSSLKPNSKFKTVEDEPSY